MLPDGVIMKLSRLPHLPPDAPISVDEIGHLVIGCLLNRPHAFPVLEMEMPAVDEEAGEPEHEDDRPRRLGWQGRGQGRGCWGRLCPSHATSTAHEFSVTSLRWGRACGHVS